MAKKENKKNDKKNDKKKKSQESFITQLPQNILFVGDKVDENKSIYISQSVYKEIHAFTKDKTTNESGGILVGNVIEEFGKTNIIIQGFVEAKYCEATPTTLKFTHKTWEHIHEQIEKKFEDGQIVGWIHTHPDFGVFLSEYDLFIQENFFNESYQVAYVVDPIRHEEGFYFWINDRIEKCKGFYIFEITNKKIDIEDVSKKDESNGGDNQDKTVSYSKTTYVVIGILVFLVVVSVVFNFSLLKRVGVLEEKQEIFVESISRNLRVFSQKDVSIETKVNSLEDNIYELHPELKKKTDDNNGSGYSDKEKATEEENNE